MDKYILTAEQRDSLLAYLRSRPLGEVLDGFIAISNLPLLPPLQVVAKADMSDQATTVAQAEAS